MDVGAQGDASGGVDSAGGVLCCQWDFAISLSQQTGCHVRLCYVYTRENTLLVVLAGAAGNGACVIFYLSVPTPDIKYLQYRQLPYTHHFPHTQHLCTNTHC